MEKIACCFTGHKILSATKIEKITDNLERELESLIDRGVSDFISGGALGFDQIAASLIIAKKEMGKDIRLIFALPCTNQDAAWNEKQRTLYQNLLSEADEIIYVTEKYNPFCMKRRNRYMVDHSNVCICALLREKSGTGQTVAYARKKGLHIVNVAK